jgi:hypothetical protein
LLQMQILLTQFCYLCIREVSLFKSCLAPPFLTCFFLSRRSLLGGVFSSSLKGEKILSKGEHSFRRSNNLVLQLILIDKSFMRASLICFLHVFNVFLFGGWCQRGRNLGTKAMKLVSNTKHHQFKILILQVVLVLWSKRGSKWIIELGGGLSP